MKEIKTLKDIDLKKTLSDKREALRNFRFGSAGSKTRNVREGRAIRKNIAQVLTEVNARNKEM